ncbi:MAG: AAA family ATPase [Thermodesulfobacteriota bacterium]|nr:AAA family ATPase [Thermodesulfobacteriota bacterium]
MIKSISIRNFMALESLDLQLTAPLNIITGQNESGKSSIRDALLWAFTGQARSLKTHADQAALIREGAKSAEVHVTLGANQTAGPTFVRRKTPKTAATVSGEVPDIGLNPAILFDPYTFLFLPEAQRRELLFQVIPGLTPTAADICARLGQDERFKAFEGDETNRQGASLLAIVKIAASQGFPAAEKEAVARRREVKRVLESLSEVKEPGKTATIDNQEYDIPTLNFAAIEGALKELQAQKDDLLRQKGAAEARTRRRDQTKTKLERIDALIPPDVNDIMILEKELTSLNESIQKVTKEIAKAQTRQEFFPANCPVITLAPTSCPNAGQMVGQDPPAPGVIEALQQNKAGFAKTQVQTIQKLQEARRQNEEYNVAMGRKAALEEELTKMESEPESGVDLYTEIATRERRIARGRAFQKESEDYGRDLAEFQAAQEKVATCEQEIALYDALAKALAPDGIPSQMIVEAMEPVNSLLREAAEHLFPERPLCLTPALDINLAGSPFATLSKSARFRVGIAFQYALARLSGSRLLMIDEADILDYAHRAELTNFLLTHLADFDQIFVFFTSDEPFCIADPRVQSWWLENGRISELVGVHPSPGGHLKCGAP